MIFWQSNYKKNGLFIQKIESNYKKLLKIIEKKNIVSLTKFYDLYSQRWELKKCNEKLEKWGIFFKIAMAYLLNDDSEMLTKILNWIDTIQNILKCVMPITYCIVQIKKHQYMIYMVDILFLGNSRIRWSNWRLAVPSVHCRFHRFRQSSYSWMVIWFVLSYFKFKIDKFSNNIFRFCTCALFVN